MHILQRGNNRSACFSVEADYHRYLHLLGELAAKFECDVHAYVLMTNHVHLLATPTHSDSASLMMKHLGQQYVQYVNRTKKRTGSLWEGRFKSSIVDHDQYLFRCHRYIEMNPVRAGMVTRPQDYPWSSHRANAHGMPSELLTPHPQVVAIGAAEYLRMFDSDLTAGELEEIRAAAAGGFVLGSTQFAEALEETCGRHPGRQRKRHKA